MKDSLRFFFSKNKIPKRNCYYFSVCGIIQLFENIWNYSKVWPNGQVVFPDFFKTATKNLWKQLIRDHREQRLVMDGLWIVSCCFQLWYDCDACVYLCVWVVKYRMSFFRHEICENGESMCNLLIGYFFFQFKIFLIAYNNGHNFCVLWCELEQRYENELTAEITKNTYICATYLLYFFF